MQQINSSRRSQKDQQTAAPRRHGPDAAERGRQLRPSRGAAVKLVVPGWRFRSRRARPGRRGPRRAGGTGRSSLRPVGAGRQRREDGLAARVGRRFEGEAGSGQPHRPARHRPRVVADRELEAGGAGLGEEGSREEEAHENQKGRGLAERRQDRAVPVRPCGGRRAGGGGRPPRRARSRPPRSRGRGRPEGRAHLALPVLGHARRGLAEHVPVGRDLEEQLGRRRGPGAGSEETGQPACHFTSLIRGNGGRGHGARQLALRPARSRTRGEFSSQRTISRSVGRPWCSAEVVIAVEVRAGTRGRPRPAGAGSGCALRACSGS